jgi:Rap1a immunity proteins
MRTLCAVLCAVLCVLCAPISSASGQNAGDMLRACELLERGIHVEKNGNVYIPSGPELNQCWGFIKAVRQYATLADQDGKTLLDSCPDPETDTTEVLHVFVRYARAHPEKLRLGAAALAHNAMADAFPCK